MKQRILHINPEIVIIQRNEIIFTTKLPSGDGQMQLQLLDLIMLQQFFNAKTDHQVIKDLLANPYVNYLAPSMNEQMISQQIENLVNFGILMTTTAVESSQHGMNDEINNTTMLIDVNTIENQNNTLYKLSRNFALVPSVNGFSIWSESIKAYNVLSLDEILTAVLFLNGQTCQKVSNDLPFIESHQLKRVMAELIQNKTIIESIRPNDLHNQKEKSIEPVNNYPSSRHKTWEEIEVDDRIPIYFVPHMENHFPLALGLLFSAIKDHKNGDLIKKFNLIPITYFTPENLLNVVYRKFGKGIWLFSNYMWSLELNLEISRLVKGHDATNLTIHGGPSTPNYRQASIDFMSLNSSIDISVHGEGEIAISEILDCIYRDDNAAIAYSSNSLNSVAGITYKENNQFTKTVDRVRMDSPDSIPSPYLEGWFDHYNGRVDAAIIESNRGCPFGCTFCDWGSATNQKVKKYDLERTKKEIEWIAKSQTKILWIADANFGMYERDIELSAHIVKVKEQYGYPQEVVVNYTKNTTWRLAEIIKLFTQGNIISQGIISIQTTDKMTLEVINRKNIKTNKYDELAKVFADENLPLSTDLMIGLPGITIDAFKSDIQRYMDLDVAIKAYPTQLLPNSPMADPEYIKKHKIEIDDKDFIISSYSFSQNDLAIMKKLYKFYTIADGYSTLRYVLRYLQWHYKIKSISFLYQLMLFLDKNPEKYPHLTWGFKYFDMEKCIPGGWHIFYKELKSYMIQNLQIKDNTELETVLLVNKLSMPDDTQSYPLLTKLKHDFVKYFKQYSQDDLKDYQRLSDFNTATFEVNDPSSMAFIDLNNLQYDTHQYFWELSSSIARAKSHL